MNIAEYENLQYHSRRSHSLKKIMDAYRAGEQIWLLDTDGAGDDDVLIGTRDEVIADIMHHHELPKWPKKWSLERWGDG